MATTIIKASLLGQVAGTNLENYVAQNGDIAATFTRIAARSIAPDGTTAMHLTAFAGGYGVKEGLGGNVAYLATTQTAVDSIDMSVTLTIAYPQATTDYKIMFAGDDGAGNHLDINYSSTNNNFAISVYEVLAGATTVQPSLQQGIAAPAAGDHVLTAQFRGTGATRTVQMLFDGQTVGPATPIKYTTIIGRSVGLGGYYSNNGAGETAALGAKLKNFQVVQNTAPVLLSPTPRVLPSAAAGSASISYQAATGGTGPYSYQVQRATVANGVAGAYANVGAAQNAPSTIIDAGLTPGTAYSYQVLVTDSTATSATSAATAFSPPLPGAIVTSSPASALLTQGGALTIAVSVAPIGGYAGTLTLSCTGLPSWVTATFNPPTLPGGNGVSTLTLSAAGNATTGTAEIGVQGSDGALIVSAPILLQVAPPGGAVYPAVGDVQPTDLVTISRNGTTEQVPASVLKTFLAN